MNFQTIPTPFVIFSGIILIVAGGVWQYVSFKPSIRDMNNGYSDAFHGGGIQDILKAPDKTQAVEFSWPKMKLSGPVDPVNGQLPLQFRFTCETACPQLWLNFLKESDELAGSILIYHPVLADLGWFYIEENGWRLYQKHFEHTSVDRFLANAPLYPVITTKEIATLNQFRFPIVFLEELTEIPENAQAVLVQYQEPEKIGEWYYFRGMVGYQGEGLRLEIETKEQGVQPSRIWFY